MKKKNRICTSVLAMTLLAGMPAMSSMPLYAAGTADEHTVTLSGAVEGTTYKAYQIFKGTYDAENANTLGEIAWGNGVDSSALITTLKEPWHLGENPTAAEIAGKLAEGDALTFRAAAESAVTGGGTVAVTNDEVTKFTGLTTGYYLVIESTGEGEGSVTRSFIMQVVGGDTSITVKNSNTPTAEKHVQENTSADKINKMLTAGGEGYQDAADYNVGDTIPFVLKAGNLPTPESIKDWKEYSVTFEDKMSSGLTLDETSIHVYKATSNESGALTWGNDDEITATVNIDKSPEDSCTFHVDVPIKNAGDSVNTTKNYSGNTLVVTFDAKLNKDAVHGIPDSYEKGNYNNFTLAYTNDPNTGAKKKTDEDHTLVFTYDMQVSKVDGSATTKKLSGAEFKVYKTVGENKSYYSINTEGEVVFTATEADATVFTTNEHGALTKAIAGIDEGTYYITETKAPDGYNKLSEDIEVVLTAKKNNELAVTTGNVNDVNGGLSYTIGETTADAPANTDTPVITVKNNKGTVLPSTGGMGTTVLYTVGGLLVVGAGVFLIAGKRMKKEED